MYETFRTTALMLNSLFMDNLLQPVPQLCGAIGTSLSMGLLCGRKLTTLHIPDRPLLSPFVRHVGILASKSSQVATLLLLAVGGITAALAYMGTSVAYGEEIIIYAIFIGAGSIVGTSLSLPIIYRWLPLWARADGLDDVEHMAARLKKLARGFNPESYFNISKGIFLGRDEKSAPVYVPKESLQKNHWQIIGESGTGKSSLAGVLLAQCAMLGETVIAIDPKDDVYLAGALARIAERHGIPFHVIDLRPSAPPQINPLLGCTRWHVEELLVAAFELGKSGEAGADFYRGEDRDACAEVAKLYVDGANTIPQLFHACAKIPAITERSNLWREFRQFATLPAFHAREGLDLERVSAGHVHQLQSLKNISCAGLVDEDFVHGRLPRLYRCSVMNVHLF